MDSQQQHTQPSFIGIGAQKCASTWIYDILSDHPEVCVSTTKEVNFFSYHYDHGFQWYERQLGDGAPTAIRGEISPSYFYEPAVPERIASYVPGVKLLVSLRDPVDRAISNHKHEVREGHLIGPDLSLDMGLRNNPTYVEQGLYAKHLRNWYRHFAPDQILVVLFEDVLAQPEQVARQVYRFLEIDDTHVSAALGERSNVGHLHRSSKLHDARRAIRLGFEALGLAKFWETIARLGLRNLYRRYNWLPSDAKIPPVSDETKRRLRRQFEADVVELERLIARDLAAWKSAQAVEPSEAMIETRPATAIAT